MTQEGGMMEVRGRECFREEEVVHCQMLLRHQGGQGSRVTCSVYNTGVVGVLDKGRLSKW